MQSVHVHAQIKVIGWSGGWQQAYCWLAGSRSSYFQLIPALKSEEAALRKCDMLSAAPVISELSVPSAEALAMSSIWCRAHVPVIAQSSHSSALLPGINSGL